MEGKEDVIFFHSSLSSFSFREMQMLLVKGGRNNKTSHLLGLDWQI